MLQLELTKQVLLYICKDVQPTDKEMGVKEELIKNEIYALQYLEGYIFHKFYKKFKQHLKNNEIYMQYCSILLAGKVHQDEEQIIVNAKNRGGLWKVDSDVQNMFLLIEKLFRKERKVFVTKINDKCITETAIQGSNLLQFYENLCSKAEIKIDDEISFNLLENLLGLFVHVRSHIYACNIKERHKLKVKEVKKRYLRTELKKKIQAEI